ncbi:CoxG family protein [Muriicola sp. Z0-33]|uniref:CoxG family protein n=1 Tax=Muriicola sp. Z0-33 TaxID=2816957 RepID=UPI0022383528|nr:carbon monoxide dehydrogenase subunit G [Muriicola sp. Z0-33]MCW5516989.1 carbon monoxide dehydrogenase subunit G [Muriicola sp. Z0-33]
MKVSGSHTLNTTPVSFWNMVMDPEILEKITPGVKELKEKGEDTYHAISEVKVGPVKGEFKGELSIKDKVENHSCVLVVDQKSKMGNVVAEIQMNLEPLPEGNTQINYTGTAKMSGVLARMGQRIMSGVVSTLSKQFFQAMETHIKEQQQTES